MKDKKNLKRLNFGCRLDIREGWDNVDIQNHPKFAQSFDFNVFPYPIKDNVYDYILADNILEHLDDLKKVLDELWRISKSNAEIEIIVPHYHNKGAYVDFQHIHYFSDNSFIDFANNDEYFNEAIKFKITELELRPTRVGRMIFSKWLRGKLSLFVGGLIADIRVKFRVIKQNDFAGKK